MAGGISRGWNITILAAATAAGALFVWRGYALASLSLWACPFKAVTGVPCPGCGLTRAALALVHGQVRTALWINPLSVLVCLWAAVSWVWIAVDVARGSDTYWPIYRRLWAPWAVWAAVAALAANWAWNIYKCN